jgi:PspA associated protein B
MGFLDSLLGKTRIPESKTDSLFAITTAAITIESSFGLKPSEKAAICFKPMESSKYDIAQNEIEDLLKLTIKETKTKYKLEKDRFGFLWVILDDKDFEDLVTIIQMISQTLIDHGFGTQLLCAVYSFKGAQTIYWIYSFKQGLFYPFAPLDDQKRDNSLEFRLKALLERELPVEKDIEKWYPLWDLLDLNIA